MASYLRMISKTAQILCDQFQQVFVNHRRSNLINCAAESSDELSALHLFTESTVYKKLCMLNVTKSPGPDAVHPHLLKNCVDLLAYPLMRIFQKSFQDSCLPNDWKSAIVTPLFKKGSKLDPGNYRPIPVIVIRRTLLSNLKTHRTLIIQHYFASNSEWLFSFYFSIIFLLFTLVDYEE